MFPKWKELKKRKVGTVVMCVSNPNTQKTEAGGSSLQPASAMFVNKTVTQTYTHTYIYTYTHTNTHTHTHNPKGAAGAVRNPTVRAETKAPGSRRWVINVHTERVEAGLPRQLGWLSNHGRTSQSISSVVMVQLLTAE